MEFVTRVLSGNSKLKDRVREAKQINQAFKENLGNLKRVIESEEREDIFAVLNMVYETSFPEDKIFMKIPSRGRLKTKKELVVRILIGLDSLGVPGMAEMLVFIRKYNGPEGVVDSLMTLLEILSSLLECKEAPGFSSDDVMDAMDFEWHSPSGIGSPLLGLIASATSSPRASAASVGDSPLHPLFPASPYRLAKSVRSMPVSRSHEVDAKWVLDKTSTVSMPPQRPSLTMSASLQYHSTNQDFHSGQPTILKIPASSDNIQETIDEKPYSFRFDTLPVSSQHGLERKHRRKSSSLQDLFVESNDELSREGSSKHSSHSSSWRRNSSELTKIISSNISETSSPTNPGLAAGDSKEGASIAPNKEFQASIHTQDNHVNGSSQRKSRHISPSPAPPNEAALQSEDSGGFSVDLVSSNERAAQTSVSPPIQLKSSANISNFTEGHSDVAEVSSVPDDSIKPRRSNILAEEKDILAACGSSSLNKDDFAESLNAMSQTDAALFLAEEYISKPHCTEEPPEIEGVSRTTQNQKEESGEDAYEHHGDCNVNAFDSAASDSSSTTQAEYLEEDVGISAVSDTPGNGKDLNSFASSSGDERELHVAITPCEDIQATQEAGDERENKELHATITPCEDIQATKEAGDLKPSCPVQDQGQFNIQYGSHCDSKAFGPVQLADTECTYASIPSHVDSHQQSEQQVLNEPATFSDPTEMDTNMPRSKRKGGRMGKLTRGCLSCCTKPHTHS